MLDDAISNSSITTPNLLTKSSALTYETKSTILEGFLKVNKVPFEKADSKEKLELPDIAEKAETFTVLVGCWE
jgi:hypothetical protein